MVSLDLRCSGSSRGSRRASGDPRTNRGTSNEFGHRPRLSLNVTWGKGAQDRENVLAGGGRRTYAAFRHRTSSGVVNDWFGMSIRGARREPRDLETEKPWPRR